mmetsp:Transcript_4694/g.11178  ORF Transcript_4694/g.11178 Transcript_4694/m.11178 type:complete len:193 (+) Transcript_4694:114-692(+)
MGKVLEELQRADFKITSAVFHSVGAGGYLGDKAARALWECVSLSADGLLWFGAAPLHLLASAGWRVSPSLLTPTASLVASGLLCDIAVIVSLKFAFKRKRPPFHKPDARFVGVDVHSFPSGHATRCWCLVALLGSLHPHHAPLLAAWGLLVSLSRVALGRHYVSDVVAGSLVGFFCTAPAAAWALGAARRAA